MDNLNYKKAEDFLTDEGFCRYVTYNEDENGFWESFIIENPDLISEIETAKKLVCFLNSAKQDPVEVDKYIELQRLQLFISKNEKRKNLKLKVFKYAAAILLLISSVYLFNINDFLLYREYVAEQGNTRIKLQDSTLINLRKGSELKVSRFYNLLNRDVKLDGEAFFEVRRNEKSKFIVQTENSTVTVLGTRFNIAAYPDSSIVIVEKGKVFFESVKTNEELILTQKMKASCSRFSEMQLKSFSVNQIGWSAGEFHFIDLSMQQILSLLESYYPVKFKCTDRYLKKRLSFHVDDMDLNELLILMKSIVPGLNIQQNSEFIQIQ